MFFNNKETDLYWDFWKQHNKKCRASKMKVTIYHTEIGTAVKVKCPKCGKKKDITDYNVW